jgi:hypothetical protein
VYVLRLVLCAPVNRLGGPFIRKYAIKEENYKEYPGSGSQNLNANFNICLALFLGWFDCVFSIVEKSGCEGFCTQRSHIQQMYGSTWYEWDKTPILPPVLPSWVRVHSAGKHNRRTHDTPAHRLRYHALHHTPPNQFLFSSNSEGSKKLPDDGRLLPKYVGASI